MIAPELAETLARLSAATPLMRDPWWLIGSAAMALHGAAPITVADVDLLASPSDARRLAQAWGIALQPSAPSPLFRSEVYFQWPEPPVPVDVMAGFQVMTPQGWAAVRPRTRVAVGGLFTPDLSEQIEILERFGRPKDLARVTVLRALT
ncbi:hypothetical protein [Phenylobacterium sp.]|uniref:hypothetical protein n=1 Tax=Phenylobacterium sp. TaxID=1871053 RepID=UPI0035B40040